MSCHNKSAGMTPLGEAVHERCKTGECSITTATVRTTTAAAVVALLVLSDRPRLMEHILSKPQDDASVQEETKEGGRGEERIVKQGTQEDDGDRDVEGEGTRRCRRRHVKRRRSPIKRWPRK